LFFKKNLPTGETAMVGNMKFHKLALTFLWIYCLGFLLISAPPVAARVPVYEEWLRTYGFSSWVDAPVAITTDPLGYVYVTGGSYDPDREQQSCATIKYSPTGEQLWVARFNSNRFEYALPMAINVDDSYNVIVTGTAYSSTDFIHFLTVSYDHNGNIISHTDDFYDFFILWY
jgi:hypothetical protein